jgi:hypothetical protein
MKGEKMADEGRGKMDDGRKDDTKDQNLLSSFIIAKRSSILHRSFAEGLTHLPTVSISHLLSLGRSQIRRFLEG